MYQPALQLRHSTYDVTHSTYDVICIHPQTHPLTKKNDLHNWPGSGPTQLKLIAIRLLKVGTEKDANV